MSSITEQSRINHDDELPTGASASVAETPAATPADTQPIMPFEYASKTPNHKEPMSGRKKLLYAGIATAAGLSLVGGLVGLTSNGKSTPKIGDTPKPTETSQVGPTSNPNGGGEVSGAEVLLQTTSIEAMDNMKGPAGLKAYANLPYADHLAYALAKNPEMAIATPGKDLGFTDPTYIPGYYWDSVNGFALSQSDTTEGAKIAAANNYYTVEPNGDVSPGYQATVDSIQQTGGQGVMNSTTDVFVASGKPQAGVDLAGHKINYINVTFYDADSTSGKRQGPDKTAQAIRQEVKLLDGKTVVFYPIGLTGPGQAAPDGGTY